MNFEFYPEAESEYLEDARYYDRQRDGLGDYFTAEIEATIARICRNPLAWRKLSRHTRRCLAKNFPYGIIYFIEKDRIIILSVMHLSRKPGYWKARLRDLKKRKS